MGVDRNSHLGDVDVDLERQGEVASSSSTSSVDGSREEGLLGSQVVEGAYNLEVEAQASSCSLHMVDTDMHRKEPVAAERHYVLLTAQA